ncbi:hypothetical protein ACLI4Z_16215 [Natrialbaceae archaeon A-arb3/5]
MGDDASGPADEPDERERPAGADEPGTDETTEWQWGTTGENGDEAATETPTSGTDDAVGWSSDAGTEAERDRIPLDLSGGRDDEADDAESDEDEYGPEPSSAPVEAGNPSLESALFVAVGAVAMILTIVYVVSLLF